MLNGEVVEELSTVVHVSKARQYGKDICARLKETIPKQLFQVAIQATVGAKVIARENIAALRKDVTAKCVSPPLIYFLFQAEAISAQTFINVPVGIDRTVRR